MRPGLKIFIWVLIIAALIGVIVFISTRDITVTPDESPTPSLNGENNDSPAEKSNIVVSSPQPGSTILSPIIVRGEARVFENNVIVRVTYPDGRHIMTDFTTARADEVGTFGAFDAELFLPKLSSQDIVLEVLWESPEDASDLDVVRIPLTVETLDTTNVQVYFSNDRLDPEALDCISVFPVTREMAKTQDVARLAIIELLKGPNALERAQNYFTSIPQTSVRLNSLDVVNGQALADFNEWLDYQVGGSCRVQAIRSQIERTLKQFPSIQNVVVSINGRAEDILQP